MHLIADLRKLYSPTTHQKMDEVFFSSEPYQDSMDLESIAFTPMPSWCEKNSDEMTMSVFKAIPVPSKDVCDYLAGDLERLREDQCKSIKIYNAVRGKGHFVPRAALSYWSALYSAQEYYELCASAWPWMWNNCHCYDTVSVPRDISIDFVAREVLRRYTS